MSRYGGDQQGTPYIPALDVPTTPEPTGHPVLPDAQSHGALPAWANGPSGPSQFPGYNQPGATPYPNSNPYLQPGPPGMFQQPSSYFPPPAALPTTPYNVGYPNLNTPASNPGDFTGWGPSAATYGQPAMPNYTFQPPPAQPQRPAMAPPIVTNQFYPAPLPPNPMFYGYPQGVPTPYGYAASAQLPYSGISPGRSAMPMGGDPSHPGMHQRNTSYFGILNRADKDNCDFPPSKFSEGDHCMSSLYPRLNVTLIYNIQMVLFLTPSVSKLPM